MLDTLKRNKQPFFLSFNYCVGQAANAIPEFRQRIIHDEIVEYETCRTSHTLALDDGTYCFCNLDCLNDYHEYLPYAIKKQAEDKLKNSATDHDDVNELFFISTLPWFSFTALSNPVPTPADSNPRITWGKYFNEQNKVLIPVSVLCNHALVDGLHLAQFYDELNRQMEKLVHVL